MMLHLYIFFLHGQVNEFYYHFRFVVVQFFFISFSLCGKRWRIRKGACIFCVSAFAEAAILHSLSKSIPFSSLLLFSCFFLGRGEGIQHLSACDFSCRKSPIGCDHTSISRMMPLLKSHLNFHFSGLNVHRRTYRGFGRRWRKEFAFAGTGVAFSHSAENYLSFYHIFSKELFALCSCSSSAGFREKSDFRRKN